MPAVFDRPLVMQYMTACRAGDSNCGFVNVRLRVDNVSPVDPIFGVYVIKGTVTGIAAGDSGSIIRDTASDGATPGEPLGILVEGSDDPNQPNLAIAFSEVRKMVGQPRALSPVQQRSTKLARPVQFIDFAGVLASQDCGPTNLFMTGNCTFQASPSRGKQYFSVVFRPTDSKPVSSVRVAFADSAPLPDGFEVLSSESGIGVGGTWVSLRYCVPTSNTFTCSIAPQNGKTYMLRFQGTAAIASIQLE